MSQALPDGLALRISPLPPFRKLMVDVGWICWHLFSNGLGNSCAPIVTGSVIDPDEVDRFDEAAPTLGEDTSLVEAESLMVVMIACSPSFV